MDFSYRGPDYARTGPPAGYAQGVANATPGCVRDGCQFRMAAGMLEQAAAMVSNLTRGNMSAALWCDAGGHAFSERDPGRQRISISVLQEDDRGEPVIDAATGQAKEVMEARDFCGECAKAAGLLKRRTRPGEYDPLKVKALERQLGVGQDGT